MPPTARAHTTLSNSHVSLQFPRTEGEAALQAEEKEEGGNSGSEREGEKPGEVSPFLTDPLC